MTRCRRIAGRLAARRRVGALLAFVAVAGGQAAAGDGAAMSAAMSPALSAELLRTVEAKVTQAARADPAVPAGARVVVELGRLDPRLRLAPCARVEHQLAARAWGSTKVTLRCADGPSRWQVQLPVTVQVLASGWVAAVALPAGSELRPDHLREAEVDLAGGAFAAADRGAIGRTLARALAAGEALRAGDLRARRWFDAGDTVRLVAVGHGYSVSGQGQALAPGIEGQRVRVRTDSGRVVTGTAVGQGEVEVAL